MSDVNILAVKPGSLSVGDKRALRKVGVVVIEHEEPESVRIIAPTSNLPANDILGCALNALNSEGGYDASRQREKFTRLMCAAVNAKTTPPKGRPGGSC